MTVRFAPDFAQQYENCFITESYLCGQYDGIRTDKHPEQNISWDSVMFLPSFRLLSNYELKTVTSKIEFRKYNKSKLKFLYPWQFEVTKKCEEYEVKYSMANSIVDYNLFSAIDEEFDFDYFEEDELTLNNDKNMAKINLIV